MGVTSTDGQPRPAGGRARRYDLAANATFVLGTACTIAIFAADASLAWVLAGIILSAATIVLGALAKRVAP